MLLLSFICACQCLEVEILDHFKPKMYFRKMAKELNITFDKVDVKRKEIEGHGRWIYGRAGEYIFSAVNHPKKEHSVQVRVGKEGELVPAEYKWAAPGKWAVIFTKGDAKGGNKVFYKIKEDAVAKVANAANADTVINIAAGEIGYVQANDPEEGSKYGRWFASYTGESWYGGNDIAYCCMFVSWCMNQAGASASGLPNQYCPNVVAAAKNEGTWISKSSAVKGDLVLFDWSGCYDGEADHIGFCETNDVNNGIMYCIEGNTDGGKVLRRTRYYDYILGCVRPAYDGSSGGSSGGSSSGGSSSGGSSGSLAVDGYIGSATVSAWQRALGTTVDGIISGQCSVNKQYLERLNAVSWECCGSVLVQAIQRKVGSDADGYMGPNTVKAIQRFVGVDADGYLGQNTAKAIQQSLNDGKW